MAGGAPPRAVGVKVCARQCARRLSGASQANVSQWAIDEANIVFMVWWKYGLNQAAHDLLLRFERVLDLSDSRSHSRLYYKGSQCFHGVSPSVDYQGYCLSALLLPCRNQEKLLRKEG